MEDQRTVSAELEDSWCCDFIADMIKLVEKHGMRLREEQFPAFQNFMRSTALSANYGVLRTGNAALPEYFADVYSHSDTEFSNSTREFGMRVSFGRSFGKKKRSKKK